MRKTGLALALLLVGTGAPAFAAESAPPAAAPAAVPAQSPAQQYADAIQAAQETGRRLFRHERAAALANGALQATRKYRRDKRVQGWLTEARADAVRVDFIGQAGAEPAVIYQVEVGDDARAADAVQALDTPQPLADSQRNAWQARASALAAQTERCGKQYGVTVLPAVHAGGPGWTAFLRPLPAGPGQLPVGGSYRFEISADGQRIENSRGFTMTCLVMGNDVNAISLMLTHLMDPIPTEIHVALGLHAGKGVFVATTENRSLWAVENGVIRYVDALK